MHTLSPLIRTVCGGTGVGTIRMAAAGDSAGDGVRRGIIIAGMLPVIGPVAIGVVTGAAIGGLTIITIIRIMDGAEDTGAAATDGRVRHIMIPAGRNQDTVAILP